MTWILLAGAWFVLAAGVALLLGSVVRLADRRAAEDRLFTLLETDLRSTSSLSAAHGTRAPAAG